jgi:phytoene synthase
MALQLRHSWEYQLLSWAQEAMHAHTPSPSILADADALKAAYAHCDEITRTHSRTFFLASSLLPTQKRHAARALYAFCRVTDDIVDEYTDPQMAQNVLNNWRDRTNAAHPPATDMVALAWADTKARFDIPWGYSEQLIDGVARDMKQKRYETFDDLAGYSYGVASTVGLMAMHIIGFSGEDALPYAVRLGVALQVTNILRDVAEDWQMGRLYLPLEDLAAFDLSEDDIERGIVDDRWRDFMRFQIDRTRHLYAESLDGIAMLDSDGRFAIGVAAELYQAILEDIEAHDYDVFTRRAHISMIGKMSRLPGIWRRSRRAKITA